MASDFQASDDEDHAQVLLGGCAEQRGCIYPVHDAHIAKDGAGRGCLHMGSNRCALSYMSLVRASNRRNGGKTCWNSRSIQLGSCSLRRIVSSKKEHLLRRRGQGLETHLSVVWVASWLLLHAGDEVDECTHGVLSMTKEILHAWAHVFNDKYDVNYASGQRSA